jgi:hypothetical protein
MESTDVINEIRGRVFIKRLSYYTTKNEKDHNLSVTVTYKSTSVPSKNFTLICPSSEIVILSNA